MEAASEDIIIENFFSQFRSRQFQRGEVVLSPEENPTEGLYLKAGHVRVYALSSDGTEITIHIFNPGSFFPMTSILNNIPNRYYYEALTDVYLQSAPKESLVDFLKRESTVLFNLTKRIFAGVDKLSLRLEQLAFDSAYKRVISILVYLARHFGQENGSEIHFTQPFTHREIASLAGISRETASREWEKLQKKNIITYDRKTIVINNLLKLEDELKSV